jgi:hypothetical protein
MKEKHRASGGVDARPNDGRKATTKALTLPGDIKGLLRRGTPVVFRCGGHVPGTVVKFADHKGIPAVPWVWWEPRDDPNGLGKPSLRDSILLDLTFPTGRWHAVLWLDDQPNAGSGWQRPPGMTLGDLCDARNFARTGKPMTPEQIDTLRRVVLHVAGRTA